MAKLFGSAIDARIKRTVKFVETTAIGWQNAFYSVLAFSITMLVMFWASVFLYATFYFTYLPQESISWPVHLQYTPCETKAGVCSLPEAYVDVMHPTLGSMLARGQKYRVVVDLEMPESDVNQNVGMFQLKMEMRNNKGVVFKSSTRSTMLRYKSPLFHSISTVFFAPLLLHGIREQSQPITVELFSQYQDDPRSPLSQVYVEVQSKYTEIYSVKLRIHAEFSGLRYMMHFHPTTSALIGISIIMSFLATLVIFSWYQFNGVASGQLRNQSPSAPRRLNKDAATKRKISSGKAMTSDGYSVEAVKPNEEVNDKENKENKRTEPDLIPESDSTLHSRVEEIHDESTKPKGESQDQKDDNEDVEEDEERDYEVVQETRTETEIDDEEGSSLRKRCSTAKE